MKDRITVTMGTCGISAGAKKVADELSKRADVNLKATSCIGMCSLEPTVMVESGDNIKFISYVTESKQDIDDVVALHKTGVVSDNLRSRVVFDGKKKDILTQFFKGQHRIVLRNSGWIDPLNIQDYLDVGGYKFLAECFEGKYKREDVLNIVKSSGL
ncbi:MAG: (2Fe-2S) ferredoxin domain-containing protein, partial [bacterium]